MANFTVSAILVFIGTFGLFAGYDAVSSAVDENAYGDRITLLVGIGLILSSIVAFALGVYLLKIP